MRLLQQEYKDQLIVDWRAFMLRPEPGKRGLDKFRTYTEKWQFVGSEPDAGTFRTWASDEPPPSHSVPPHLLAKAAARIGPDAFDRVHFALLKAYFYDSRDISNRDNLQQIWNDAGLPSSQFEMMDDPALLEEVLAEHQEAVECSANGAPSFRTPDNDLALTGAHPMPLFRRWINKELARLESGTG